MARKKKPLEESEDLYQKIFNLVPTSIVVVDKHGTIIDINPYHISTIGRDKTEKKDYVGRNIIKHPSVVAAGVDKNYKKVLRGDVFEQENVFFPETTGGIPGFYNIKAAPIIEKDEIIGAVMIHENITEQNIKARKIEESNVALKILLQQATAAKHEIEENILDNIKLLIMPYLGELESRLQGTPEISFLEALVESIDTITSSFVKNIRSEFLNLTPREIQVANLIRQGKTNKDIALLLGLSVRTIEFYRGNLRKKFKIHKKKISLRSYLLVKS